MGTGKGRGEVLKSGGGQEDAGGGPPTGRVRHLRRIVSLSILGALTVVLVGFAVGRYRSFVVVSRSMEPALQVGDCVLMSQAGDGESLLGKVVAFQLSERDAPMAKRVVAEPGSIVQMRRGFLYVNGRRDRWAGSWIIERPDRLWLIGCRELFVMGDNRGNSDDSVEFGPVRRSAVLGVLVYRYWPLSRIGEVE